MESLGNLIFGSIIGYMLIQALIQLNNSTGQDEVNIREYM